MADLGAVRQAIATALANVGTDVQVSAYLVPQPTPPTLQVLPGEQNYDRAFKRGLDVRTFTIQGFVAANEATETQERLDELMAPTGTRSVKTVLEADPTLGGVVSQIHVTRDSGYSMQLHPSGIWVLLCEWTAEVYLQN